MQLSSVLAKVFANNRILSHLFVSYKHAHFEDCLKIADNLICSVKAGLNNIRCFNGFYIHDYICYKLNRSSLCELAEDFDYASYDTLYCALVVKLLIMQSFNLNQIEFNPLIASL